MNNKIYRKNTNDNSTIEERFIIKIADFGMSKFSEKGYYKKGTFIKQKSIPAIIMLTMLCYVV